MAAVQALTGLGGWPLNVWLSANREPFFGGTYFPPRDGARGVRVGFLSLLRQMQRAHAEQGERVAAAAAELVAAVRQQLEPVPGQGLPGRAALQAAALSYRGRFDAEWGGVKGAPKFPSSLPLRFLLRHHRRSGDAQSLAMALRTLEQMAAGGIHDQLGGGFHRYAVDERWLVPHFEKMLYDNALLAIGYLEGFQASGRAEFAQVARDILGWVEREMTSPQGAFYSATDADSRAPDGRREEGRFFTWTPGELRAVLTPYAARLAESAWGVTPAGQLDGRSVLHAARPVAPAERAALQDAQRRLLAARERRPRPLRDEKVLAAWNGLMISAHARAALALGEPRYAIAAQRAADFVLGRMRERGRLLRSHSEGRARHAAYLEDYAFLIAGLLDLHEATGEPRWLREAIALDRVLEQRYEDAKGGYFATADDHERLLARAKPGVDGAEPSGNSVQALNLLRLHELLDDDRHRVRAEATLRAFSSRVQESPDVVSELLLAADHHTDTPKQIVIVTPSDRAQAAPLLDALRATFVPNRSLVVAAEGSDLRTQAALLPLLEGKRAFGGRPTAYVCERRVCERPTSDPQQFAAQLAKAEPLSEAAQSPEQRALAYLAREVDGWRREHACGSCHNNGDGARALFAARARGHAVPSQALASTREWLRQPAEWEKAPGEPGTADVKLARLQFGAALAAADAPSPEERRALLEAARALAADQDADGAWRIAAQGALGSPVAWGPSVATWIARDTLRAADASAFAGPVARAEAWLRAAPVRNVMDAAAVLLALGGRDDALALLRRAQVADGGWGPYPGAAPEPFDTALALLALSRLGAEAPLEAVRNGRAALLRMQNDAGGWKETTRPAGYQSYAQHISTSAWATLALVETGEARR
jgi:uncharacterized protein YyaL (SSP411 family)